MGTLSQECLFIVNKPGSEVQSQTGHRRMRRREDEAENHLSPLTCSQSFYVGHFVLVERSVTNRVVQV